ncbi:phytoene desaturase family protein [Corynebacterium freneyi]|uniref:phytoene desaturase family protein n=1 Tax=Corynebacterium freneyi TaxID=134034 RepID=UPI001EF22188|nr:phytoene desaturase family protein [Corynebacterium freneyi]MCG7440118.1 phytoene desaturase family protein [Corynebacterium freneyi]
MQNPAPAFMKFLPLSPVPGPRRRVPAGDGGRERDIVVIGAGLAGLTAALHLTGAGHRVTVVDSADHVGGRCATEEVRVPGAGVTVRTDTGATVWTMPQLVESALSAVGKRISDVDPAFRVERLAPAYHAMFHDGRALDVYGDASRMAAEIARFAEAGGDDPAPRVEGYHRLREWLAEMFASAYPHFMAASFDSPLDMVGDSGTAGDLGHLLQLGAFGSLGGRVESLLGDELLARVFSFQALYAGVAPKSARAVYGCIAHMDTSMGVFYPTASRTGSGMGAIAEVMAEAFVGAGGTLRLSAPVKGLSVDGRGRGVTAVVCGDESLSCDGIVATVDLPVVEGWLDDAGAPAKKRIIPTRSSPSAMVAHGAAPVEVTRQWPDRHHLISFGEAWDDTFRQISSPRGGSLMSDPSLLVTRPAVTCPDRIVVDAEGREWEPVSVLAPCPNLASADVDWDLVGPAHLAEVTAVLEDRGLTGISERWSVGRLDTPATWAEQGMIDGSPFGLAHLFRQTGPFRPRNLSPRLPSNLVLAGSTTVPGVGVPTVMLSGALAADRFTGGAVR